MKSLIAFISTALIILLASCASEAPQPKAESKPMDKAETTSGFANQMKPVIASYLQLKDALIAGDSKNAANASATFGKALGGIDMMKFSAENRQRWVIRSADLTAKGGMLVTKRDLVDQRKAFYSLSQALIATIQDMGPTASTLYIQHCPMAFENTGADWLSDSEQVVNPYFGDAMLHCGSVKETLN